MTNTTAPHRTNYLALLSLGALGVVYGDIGTSPLYAVRECFRGPHAIPLTEANILGILSLILWSLLLIISIKYLVFVLRADNRGEGGILSLAALITPMGHRRPRRSAWIVVMGLLGATLLYGDSMITPAISVLSAVEGLEVATPYFEPFIVPLTILLLIVLFFFQSRGTGRVGAVFGPVMLIWFAVLAGLGLVQLVQEPGVLRAANPLFAVEFFRINGFQGFLVLGTVFLVVTGGEALYADMGHFGRAPIRAAWFTVVLPALLLQYFGQGALLLRDPAAAAHPFFHMAPAWATLPLVVIATLATVIASQAVISGAFSLTRQAVQLGFLPRMGIEHTSEQQMGQIYIPVVNWALMGACIALVLGFKSASNLASAYGVAVTTDMVFTTLLFGLLAWRRWKWALGTVIAFEVVFLTVELGFWGANLVKIPQGGWFPLLIAALGTTVMLTWSRGRRLVNAHLLERSLPLELLLEDMRRKQPHRARGTAVFMYANPSGTPPALLHNYKHNGVLHERIVFVSVETEDVPYVTAESRALLTEEGEGVFRIVLNYGFMDDPDVPAALAHLRPGDAPFKVMETTYFLGRETLVPPKQQGIRAWREHLFGFMARNAQQSASYFHLPPNRVVELGMQIEL